MIQNIILLIIAVIVHEFGHYVAFRLDIVIIINLLSTEKKHFKKTILEINKINLEELQNETNKI